MCSECGSVPCERGCPGYEHGYEVEHCCYCGERICYGEKYTYLGDEICHVHCIRSNELVEKFDIEVEIASRPCAFCGDQIQVFDAFVVLQEEEYHVQCVEEWLEVEELLEMLEVELFYYYG